MANKIHISSGTNTPDSVPTGIGHHFIDETNKRSFTSVGTLDTSDWKQNGSRPAETPAVTVMWNETATEYRYVISAGYTALRIKMPAGSSSKPHNIYLPLASGFPHKVINFEIFGDPTDTLANGLMQFITVDPDDKIANNGGNVDSTTVSPASHMMIVLVPSPNNKLWLVEILATGATF